MVCSNQCCNCCLDKQLGSSRSIEGIYTSTTSLITIDRSSLKLIEFLVLFLMTWQLWDSYTRVPRRLKQYFLEPSSSTPHKELLRLLCAQDFVILSYFGFIIELYCCKELCTNNYNYFGLLWRASHVDWRSVQPLATSLGDLC